LLNLRQSMKNKVIKFQDLGLMDYQKTWDYQTQRFDQIIQQKIENRKRLKEKKPRVATDNYLLFVEHLPVYTLGKSGNRENLLATENFLKDTNISFYKINRGGDITYHGPGQMVGYPILDLDNFFTDLHKYLRFLEEIIIQVLQDYNLEGMRSKGETGVWLDVGKPQARKICAIGVRMSRWVTMHGFALNVNTEMNYFNHIIPCGIQGKQVTSLRKELQHEVPMQQVKTKLMNYFAKQFQAEYEF